MTIRREDGKIVCERGVLRFKLFEAFRTSRRVKHWTQKLPLDVVGVIKTFLGNHAMTAWDSSFQMAFDAHSIYIPTYGDIKLHRHLTVNAFDSFGNATPEEFNLGNVLEVQGRMCHLHSMDIPDLWIHFELPLSWRKYLGCEDNEDEMF